MEAELSFWLPRYQYGYRCRSRTGRMLIYFMTVTWYVSWAFLFTGIQVGIQFNSIQSHLRA